MALALLNAGLHDPTSAGGQDASIFQLADKCETLFTKSIRYAQGSEQPLAPAAIIEEFRSRFQAWTAYLGVYASESANLDRRLRDHAQSRNLVLMMLDMLKDNLYELISADDDDDDDDDEASVLSTDSGSLESESSQASGGVHFALEGIQAALGQLDRLAISLRQAYMPSLDRKVKAFAKKRTQEVYAFEASALLAVQNLYSRAPVSLHRHLSKMMTDRYTRLMYWRSHDKKLRFDQRQIFQPDPVWQVPSYNQPKLPKIQGKSPTISGDKAPTKTLPTNIVSDTNPSSIYHQRLIRPIKLHTPEPPRGGGASSVQISRVDYPPPPKPVDGENKASCPYCYKKFDQELITDSLWWRHHVDSDLGIFGCLSDSCEDPPVFPAYKDWAAHMKEEHGDRWFRYVHQEFPWVCRPDDGVHQADVLFPRLGDLLEHLQRAHADSSLSTKQPGDPEVEEHLSRPANVCLICCFPLESTDFATKRNNPPEEHVKASSTYNIEQYGAREPATTKTGKQVAWAPMPDTGTSGQDEGDVASGIRGSADTAETHLEVIMARHIAEHLQFLSFLTFRMATNILSGEGKFFDSAADSQSSHSSKARNTSLGLEEEGPEAFAVSSDSAWEAEAIAKEEEELVQLIDRKVNSFMGISYKAEKRLNELQANADERAAREAENRAILEAEQAAQDAAAEAAATIEEGRQIADLRHKREAPDIDWNNFDIPFQKNAGNSAIENMIKIRRALGSPPVEGELASETAHRIGIAGPSYILRGLGSQPPSVDFIDNRLPRSSPAFASSPAHYDTASQMFITTYRQKSDSSERINSITIQDNDDENEVPPVDQAISQQPLQSTHENVDFLRNAMLGLMNDHFRSREDFQKNTIENEKQHEAQLARMQKNNLHLHVENEKLPSRSSSPNNLYPPQQHVKSRRTYLDERELRYLLNINDKDVDMSFIARRKSRLLNEELSRADQLVNDVKFSSWMTSTQSAKLLILWNRRPPKSSAGISPLSILCASLMPILYDHDRFISAIWFCGCHAKSGNDDTRAMLASLLAQICQQYSFDFENLEHDGINKALLQNRDPEELYTLLYTLIKTLPAGTNLVLLIDEAYVYEREQFEDGISIFDELVRLVADKSLSTTIKLLFTSTGRVRYLRRVFQQEDQILNVKTAVRQGNAIGETHKGTNDVEF